MVRLFIVIVFMLYEGIFTIGGYDISQAFISYQEQLPGTDLKITMQPIPGDQAKGIAPFWMSAYEVTWDLYDQFLFREIDDLPVADMGDEVDLDVDAVSGATTPYVDMSSGMGKGEHPVVNVTQYAASTFCAWLSAKTGRFYRLPTESEWAHACLAGKSNKYAFGNKKKELEHHAWFAGNSGGSSHPVGLKKPNDWKLYDMHGNVSEWVTIDRINEADQSSMPLYPRKLKGGSWRDNADALAAGESLQSDKQWKVNDPQIPKSLWWFTGAPHAGFRIVRPEVVPADYREWWIKPIKEFD